MKHICSALKRNGEGFTLVELIVVIAILAILAAVAYPVYTGYIDYTNKGLDRQTVGEIMNAVELADYADPSLFGENGGAMVVLSKDGIKVAGGTVGSNLEGAMEDAFGNLKSTTLSYDKWDGAPDMGLFADLPNNGNINAYTSALAENKGATQFAGHVDEIWSIITTMVNALNGEGEMFEGVSWDTGGKTPTYDYLTKIVDRTMNTDKTSIINAWENATVFPSEGEKTAVALGATLARNYAFYQYAKSHPKYNEATMGEALEKIKIQGGYDYMDTLAGSGLVGKVDVEGWADIVNDYKTNAAAQDAKAYLAMMEAASTVKGTDSLKDDAYLKAVSSYTGMLDNILSGAVNFTAIQNLATEATGNVIVVSATKVNGTLTFNVSPEDASPREESGNAANDGDSPCHENHTGPLSLQRTIISAPPPKRGAALIDSNNEKVDNILLCMNNLSCTITASTSYYESLSITIDEGSDTVIKVESGNTIVAIAPGTAKITVHGIGGDNDGETVTVSVTVQN